MSRDNFRLQGIDFGKLDGRLRSVDYPVPVEKIRRKYGDHELRLVGGSTTLDEALAECQEHRFESTEAVLQAVMNVVGSDAVGREGYTDRGAGAANPEESTNESF